MKSELPKIKSRKCSQMYKLLKEMIPHYTPEWTGSDPKDAGLALLNIFSQMNEDVINRLNQAPKKNFVAFLDMLGISLLPAQPARAPFTFKLAQGTQTEILIPERTQVTGKTNQNDELPFETEKYLLATPSQLKAVVSVDPEKDAIYIPPQGFLDGKMQKQNKVRYKIVSSPWAGSDNFQLDNVTDLNPGDFLSIGDTNPEYVIISEISGMIIHAKDPLLKDYPSDTSVEKITDFNLFDGKNMQEHSLYISHKDLFNIKSKAQFTLYINYRTDLEGALAPLKVSWEYWGEIKGKEGADWQKFDTIDGTFGLSKNGTVILNKMTEGEIKEKEINGVKSRWIRCILTKPLNIDASLPVLDNVVFKVNSSGENLAPDQVFTNDKPIDITKPFTPFGDEPKVLDTFSIANKEVFSKKGAKITIDVDVEERETGILGSPTAIFYGDKGERKVFARGATGRLIEVEINPAGKGKWIDDHATPPGTKIAPESMPSAITHEKSIYVFVRTEDGRLAERYFSGSQWRWIDCGVPNDNNKEKVKVAFDPTAIYTDKENLLSVFVTGSDNKLYEYVSIGIGLGKWIAHEKPLNTYIDSSPYVICYDKNSNTRIKVFVKGKNGNLYELDCEQGNTGCEKWYDHHSPRFQVEVNSRPFVADMLYEDDDGAEWKYGYVIFVKGTDDNLWKFDYHPNKNKRKWNYINNSGVEHISIFFEPHRYMSHQEQMETDEVEIGAIQGSIFIRDFYNNLEEYKLVDGVYKRIPYKLPENFKLNISPFVLVDFNAAGEPTGLHVFSASTKNSIIEIINDNKNIILNEYKDPGETALSPVLSWEYWNNKGWVVIKGLKDGTDNFLQSGEITFDLPEDIEATEVAGQKNFWIRVRLISGNYGAETIVLLQDLTRETKDQQLISTKQELISNKSGVRPPKVNCLKLNYAFEESRDPDKTITYNNLGYIDQTEASKIEDKFFSPFVKLEDEVKNIYLGFEKYFKGGPVRIFFAAKEIPFKDEKPELKWAYSVKTDWNELDCQDDTEGLTKQDILELLIDSDFSAQSRFGTYLYWIKGSLNPTKGEYEESPRLYGIFPNTTWALQTSTFKDEILGSSDGKSNQKFSFFNLPVLPGQNVGVKEILSEEEKQEIIASFGENSIEYVKDEKGKIIENWVLWSEVSDFFDSKWQDRHYTLDHATGKLQFGDGVNGMIPQALKDNIKASSYRSGGGKQGNVEAEEINSLKSTVAGIDSVSNTVAADGGADAAELDQMLDIGPTMISHQDRAVSAEDFQWLAKQASRKVVKAKCLPNTNNKGEKEIGWVTLIIVPDSKEDKPFPSHELRKIVQNYLEERCENTLAYKKRIHVASPSYVEINVSVKVFVSSIDEAFKVEREVKQKLNTFFHPLTGGREQKGWDFGRNVYDSDIYALLENIKGVDHVENLEVIPNAEGETVKDKENYLVSNGTHTINIKLINESDSCGSA